MIFCRLPPQRQPAFPLQLQMIVYVTNSMYPSLPLMREVDSPLGEDGGRELPLSHAW